MAQFKVRTTCQVEREYVVQAADEEQARKRMRVYVTDKDLVLSGLVEFAAMENSSAERISGCEEIKGMPVDSKDKVE